MIYGTVAYDFNASSDANTCADASTFRTQGPVSGIATTSHQSTSSDGFHTTYSCDVTFTYTSASYSGTGLVGIRSLMEPEDIAANASPDTVVGTGGSVSTGETFRWTVFTGDTNLAPYTFSLSLLPTNSNG
jgi:hypothetical protein